MLAVHDDDEADAAGRFQAGPAGDLARFVVKRQAGHNQTVGNAVELFRNEFVKDADPFTAKRQSLYLTNRGGKGKANFVSPFLGGQGTTCGEWTRPMVRNKDGTVTKGFMKASVAVGFCPVECPYCYLNMPYTDGMDVALNWEDLAVELRNKWFRYEYPINFGETSGLVEYDEWFVDEDGNGSMIQFVIDACNDADVTPFFLTKIRYPQYLRFDGTVQVGVSLMPESVRRWVAPNGSSAEELLESLAWTVKAGAIDPVIRMTAVWQQIEEYPDFLRLCRDRLGTTGWRLTLDILRFTPTSFRDRRQHLISNGATDA
jgi:DNA repair photolyase